MSKLHFTDKRTLRKQMNTFHFVSIKKIHGLHNSYRYSYVRRFLLIFTNSTTCLVDFWMFLSISLRLCNARFGSNLRV